MSACKTCSAGVAHHAFKHGSPSGYGYHRCRCALCRAWQRDASRDYYSRHSERMLEADRRRGANNRDRRESRRAWRSNNADAVKTYGDNDKRRRSTIPNPRCGDRWSDAEDAIVLRADISITEKAYMLGRAYASVVVRRCNLISQGVPRNSKREDSA